MFTNIVRRPVTAVFAAGAAAAAVLALAAPAGASTGPRQVSPEQVGYTADHARFKEVDGWVYLREPTQFAGIVARYSHSVQLWSADRVASVNLTASTSGETYTPSATIYNRGTHQVIASDPNAKHMCVSSDSCDWAPGVGGPYQWGGKADLYIHYHPATGQLHLGVYDSWGDDETVFDYKLPGQSFTTARIGTNFGTSPWDASYS